MAQLVRTRVLSLIVGSLCVLSGMAFAVPTEKPYDKICPTYGVDKSTGKQVCIDTIENGNLPTDGRYEALKLPTTASDWHVVWANENATPSGAQITHEYLPASQTLNNWTSMLTTQLHTGQNVNTLAGLFTYFSQSAKQNQAQFDVIKNTPGWISASTYNPRNGVLFIFSATTSPQGLHIFLFETKDKLTPEGRQEIISRYFASPPQPVLGSNQ